MIRLLKCLRIFRINRLHIVRFFGPYVAAEVKIRRLASHSLSRKPHQVYCLCFDTIGSEFQHNCFLESVSGSTLAKASLIDAICRAVHSFCSSLSLSPPITIIIIKIFHWWTADQVFFGLPAKTIRLITSLDPPLPHPKRLAIQ